MSGNPLLTKEQVEAWVVERADVARQHSILGARLDELDRKLAAVELLLPSAMSASLLRPETVRPRSEASFTELTLEVLASGPRGFLPHEVRTVLIDDPEVSERARKSANGVTNALSRLLSIDKVIKRGGRYYLPETLERIESGELMEETPSEDSTSFNQLMHNVMRAHGRPFTAREAMSVGVGNPEVAEKLEGQRSRIYSWLSREVYRGKLIKSGDVYSYPNENGAPEGAPDAGEGATSPNDDPRGFRLVG